MKGRPGTPPFGEAEWSAWTMVLVAIESAMDVRGLGCLHRGRLAALHERAAWHSGLPGLTAWTAGAAPTDLDVIRAPGGIYELGKFGVDADTLAVLAYRGAIRSVEDVQRRTDDELLAIFRIGPKRLAAIRRAVERYLGRAGR